MIVGLAPESLYQEYVNFQHEASRVLQSVIGERATPETYYVVRHRIEAALSSCPGIHRHLRVRVEMTREGFNVSTSATTPLGEDVLANNNPWSTLEWDDLLSQANIPATIIRGDFRMATVLRVEEGEDRSLTIRVRDERSNEETDFLWTERQRWDGDPPKWAPGQPWHRDMEGASLFIGRHLF